MKYTFHVSPNYRDAHSTDAIMRDLTCCLLVVLLCSVIYYASAFGGAFAGRIIGMAVAAVAAAEITEFLFYKVSDKKATNADLKEKLLHSYGWVTALILVLITKVNVSIYAVVVATVVAILFGKMVFGGFGQNIFNPAAFGEAIIMNTFASSSVTDFTTAATPVTTMKTYGWIMDAETFSGFIGEIGGLGKMFLGQYPSVIGGSAALVILLCGAFLIWRKDIDWHLSVSYLVTVFLLSLIAGLSHGAGMGYVAFSLLSGGVLFGAVFMMTDPVTTPVSIPGRVMFGVGAGVLTVLLRYRSKLPDGVLFSILLMNMLTPAIDKMCDGSQIKDAKNIQKTVGIWSLVWLLIGVVSAATVQAKEPAASAGGSSETPAAGSGTALALSDDYSDENVSCDEQSNDGTAAVYACKADGFGALEGNGANKATVTVDLSKKAISKIEVTSFNDTEGVGSNATTDDALAAYVGKTLDDSVDATSGATFTSKSIAAMASKSLQLATGETGSSSSSSSSASKSGLALSDDYSDQEAACEKSGEDGSNVVYACKAVGFGAMEGGDKNEAEITVDPASKSVVKVVVTKFADTDGVGSRATEDDVLAALAGKTLDDSIDEVSGATFTNKAIAAMIKAALSAE